MADETAAAEMPKSLFDRVIVTTPVVLTVIATIFAGLSSSEMELAMYWRSLAGQDQSKAASQWDLAGFKRDRSLILQTQARTLLALTDFGKQDLPEPEPEMRTAFEWMTGKGPPAPALPATSDSIAGVQQAIRERHSPEEINRKATHVSRASIDEAIQAAEGAADDYDRTFEPVLTAADKYVESAAAQQKKEHTLWLWAIRARLEQRRYLHEAKLNQGIGHLYEVRVAVSSAESDRHRVKSKNFFYVMLMAQAGVTVASVALAQRQKSLFWMLASIAGVVALLFGVYVYLSK